MKTIAKWIIAVVVALGLVVASRQAIEQWKGEASKLQVQIDQVERQLSAATDPVKRNDLVDQRRRLIASVPSIENLQWDRIALAALIYGCGLIPPGFLLYRTLIALGPPKPVGKRVRIETAIAAQLLGHLGKYVPGKAMVIVLRVGALGTDGVPPLTTALAVFVETFIVMAVGAAVAGLVVIGLVAMGAPVPGWIIAVAIMFAVVASLPTVPPVLRRIATRVSRLPTNQIESKIGIGLVLYGWMLALISWLLQGASFALLISAIPSTRALPPPVELWVIATAGVSLASALGFASLLPGGAGVRELVFTAILALPLGPTHALMAAVAHRVVSIGVESILAGGSWLWLRYVRTKEVTSE